MGKAGRYAPFKRLPADRQPLDPRRRAYGWRPVGSLTYTLHVEPDVVRLVLYSIRWGGDRIETLGRYYVHDEGGQDEAARRAIEDAEFDYSARAAAGKGNPRRNPTGDKPGRPFRYAKENLYVWWADKPYALPYYVLKQSWGSGRWELSVGLPLKDRKSPTAPRIRLGVFDDPQEGVRAALWDRGFRATAGKGNPGWVKPRRPFHRVRDHLYVWWPTSPGRRPYYVLHRDMDRKKWRLYVRPPEGRQQRVEGLFGPQEGVELAEADYAFRATAGKGNPRKRAAKTSWRKLRSGDYIWWASRPGSLPFYRLAFWGGVWRLSVDTAGGRHYLGDFKEVQEGKAVAEEDYAMRALGAQADYVFRSAASKTNPGRRKRRDGPGKDSVFSHSVLQKDTYFWTPGRLAHDSYAIRPAGGGRWLVTLFHFLKDKREVLGTCKTFQEAEELARGDWGLRSLIPQANPKPNPSKGVKLPALRMPMKHEHDVYDPREEAIRAVARGVYSRGGPASHGSWAIAVGRYGKRKTPAQIIQRSWERYQQPDDVLRKRQKYELMLAHKRSGSTYRVTQEPTAAGWRFFVWPMREGQRLPKPYKTERGAKDAIERLYATGVWPATELGDLPYTKQELARWLPPESAFRGRSGQTSRALLAKKRRRR